ncbi:MAG: sulfotransferase [Gammaproteobacteria bacterium]|nr:sulfotransferase [Gammaproteobacteria bacterium]
MKLPIAFDANRLAAEALQFAENEWRVHPQDYAGNSALILVSHGGTDNDDSFGAMAATPRLQACPYLVQALASFETVIGRSRLMRLAPGAEVKPHSDIAYYWREHIRIHVPIVTDPGVRFISDGIEVHMGAGEAWIFDNWRPHYVLNHTNTTRIHLVIDTVGSASFWRLVSQGIMIPARANDRNLPKAARLVKADDSAVSSALTIEQHNLDTIAHADTVRNIVQELLPDLRQSGSMHPDYAQLELLLAEFSHEWRSISAAYGDRNAGYPAYQRLIQRTLQRVSENFPEIRLPSNGLPLVQILRSYLPALLQPAPETARPVKDPKFDRPIVIVAAPRSGSTLLYETLARHPDIWSLGDESHAEIESIPGLSPMDHAYISNALSASEASPGIAEALLCLFAGRMRDANGKPYIEASASEKPSAVRFLEKTPKNSLRIPFLNAIFPDAYFIFLHRDPRSNLASMMEAWRSGKFVTYRTLPGWKGLPWSLLLAPGWDKLPPDDLARIVAHQWCAANEAILESLGHLPPGRWRSLAYADFVAAPGETLTKLCAFCDLPPLTLPDKYMEHGLPLSRFTLTPPSTDKWLLHKKEIEGVMDVTKAVHDRILETGNPL